MPRLQLGFEHFMTLSFGAVAVVRAVAAEIRVLASWSSFNSVGRNCGLAFFVDLPQAATRGASPSISACASVKALARGSSPKLRPSARTMLTSVMPRKFSTVRR